MKAPILIFGRVFLLVLGFFISGCSLTYYAPASQNVPLFREKKEVKLGANVGDTQNSLSAQLQGGVAVTRSIGLQGNISGFLPKGGGDPPTDHGLLAEAAVGYFRPIGENFVFETYAGSGYGRINYVLILDLQPDYPFYTDHYSYKSGPVNLKNIYIQPAFGFVKSDFNIALSAKLNANYYSETLVFSTGHIATYKNFIHRELISFEPALTLQGGGEIGKLQAQIVYGFPNISSDQVDKWHVTVGLVLNFPPKK